MATSPVCTQWSACGCPGQARCGLLPSLIFALRNRNRNHAVNINQQNRLHPYYLFYIASDGQVIANHTEVKLLLDLVRSSCKGQPVPMQSVCRLFNRNRSVVPVFRTRSSGRATFCSTSA